MAQDYEDTGIVEDPSGSIPSYMLAGNNHNLANNNYSWFDTVTKGTVGVAASAVAQVLDIAPTLGNLFGGDFEHIKTADILQGFDDDYMQYYKDHEMGVDALGFALGSIVPGTAGVKIGRAGATALRAAAAEGKFGASMSAATNLLAPGETKLLAKAVQSTLQPNNGFPIFNANTMRMFAQGAGEAALEGVAFETAVAATMYQSPVLKDQDFGDIVSNIVHGGALFGAIGGVAKGAQTYFKIKGIGRELDKVAMENRWNLVPEYGADATQFSPADRILTYLDDLHSTPAVDMTKYAGEEAWKGSRFQTMLDDKRRYVETKVRENVTALIGRDDKALGDAIYSKYMEMSPEDVAAKVWKTEEIARVGKLTKYEEASRGLEKKAASMTPEQLAAETSKIGNKEVIYYKLAGEGADTITAEAPKVLGIADKLKPGEDYLQAVRNTRQTLDRKWDAFDTSPEVAEARYVIAAKHTFKDGEVIAWNDLPYLQSAYLKGLPEVAVRRADGSVTKFTNKQDLGEFLQVTKEQIADDLIANGKSATEAAKLTDMTVAYTAERKFAADKLEDAMILTRTGDEFASPQWAKVVKNLDDVQDVNGNVLQGMVAIKEKVSLYKESANRVAANNLGEDVFKLVDINDSDILKARTSGVGGGMFSAQNENYGTLASKAQYIGRQVLGMIDKARNATRIELEPALYKLSQNEAAAIEWSVLNNRLRSIPENYMFDAASNSFKPARLVKYERELAKGAKIEPPNFSDDIPLEIPVKYAETVDVISQHLSKNAKRTEGLAAIRANQATAFSRDPEVFYPIPANPKDYKFFAYAVNNKITGAGHSQMIVAADANTLESMIAKVKESDPSLNILTKKDAENWYKAVGQFDFERTLSDVAFNSTLERGGKSALLTPATDPQKIVSDILNWHLQRDTNFVRETVAHKYEGEIATLRSMGERYSKVNTSHYTNLDPVSYVEMQANNPYGDYVKTMLGLSTAKEFPFWSPVNDMLDRRFSALFSTVRDSIRAVKSPEELERVNTYMRDAGYNGPMYDAAMVAYANHSAPKGALTAFVGKANSILSSMMLGWDPINAVNNLVGANVLRATELRSLIRSIAAKDTNAAGELAALGTVKVPGVTDSVFAPAKMIVSAMRDFTTDSGKELRAIFRERGIISDRVEQMKWVVDNLALTGKEGVTELNSKLSQSLVGAKKILESGDKLTGNRIAEEFNRFVSGHVVKQITDRAVKAGVIDESEAWAYINTFVNRVDGNYIAAQRPGVFQGPIGQAVGLFQSYQFNLLQQLFRHVGEGSVKDSAMLLGLQGSIYGLKGMPAFDAINTHIVGTASGNKSHTDLYDTVFGAAGKEAGDWLMYGMSSNALGLLSPDLKMNLYSRGDINPRNVTLLPINPANVPIVQASAKLFASMKETATKIAGGGDVWGSLLQGIEHSGVNRPLAGLAQTLQAFGNPTGRSFSTSNAGNVIASNDLISLTNLVRIAGAKPLDEAIGMDRMYNLDAYSAVDNKRRQELGEIVKSKIIAGGHPSQEEVAGFAEKYAASGGKQAQFNQWMMQLYKQANTSQVNQLTKSLGNPRAQSMQRIMGGYDMNDFTYGPR